MEYVISDTHFGHANIIRYCDRPFKDTAEMDAHMVRKWQNRVRPEDTVYHIGDVGYLKGSQTGEPTEAQKLIASLPGRKILILGNHDKSPDVMRAVGFDVVCQSMMVKVPNMNSTYVLLNHRPLSLKPYIPDSRAVPGGIDFVIHGHIHNSTPESRREHADKGELVNIPAFNINVSVEVINYEPVGLEHVVKNHIRKLKGQ